MGLRSGAWLALGAAVGCKLVLTWPAPDPQEGLTGGFSGFVMVTGLIFRLRVHNKRKLSFTFLLSKNHTLQLIIPGVIGLYVGLMTGLFGSGGVVTIFLF